MTAQISFENYEFHGQKIVDVKNQKVEYVELLCRENLENGSCIFPIAMKNFHIFDSKDVVRFYDNLFTISSELLGVSVRHGINIEMRDIEDKYVFSAILDYAKYAKDKLVIEIVENHYDSKDEKTLKNNIEKLKKEDVKIALDDFGMRYSNFRRCFYTEVDYLKIDKTLTDQAFLNKKSIDIRAVKEFIEKFFLKRELKIIVEGVGSKEKYDYFFQNEIDLLQGFYLHEPEPVFNIVGKYLALKGV